MNGFIITLPGEKASFFIDSRPVLRYILSIVRGLQCGVWSCGIAFGDEFYILVQFSSLSTLHSPHSQKGVVIPMEITIGMKGEATTLVEREDTAAMVGSGDLLVYATPCMAALMEGAACEAIAPALPDGTTSVGTMLSIEHLSATPVGLEVRAEAEVTEVDGKVITFALRAFDEAGEIGKGTHRRVIVNSQRFLDKAYKKL